MRKLTPHFVLIVIYLSTLPVLAGPSRLEQEPDVLRYNSITEEQLAPYRLLGHEDAIELLTRDLAMGEKPEIVTWYASGSSIVDLEFVKSEAEVQNKEQGMRLTFFAFDDQKADSKICSKGQVYLLNTAPYINGEDPLLSYSLIFKKGELDPEYFPVSGGKYSMVDAQNSINKFLNFQESKNEDVKKGQLVNAAILNALVDAYVALRTADQEKYQKALDVISNVCHKDELQVAQAAALAKEDSRYRKSIEAIQEVIKKAVQSQASANENSASAPKGDINDLFVESLKPLTESLTLTIEISPEGQAKNVHFSDPKDVPQNLKQTILFDVFSPDLVEGSRICANQMLYLVHRAQGPQPMGFVIPLSLVDSSVSPSENPQGFFKSEESFLPFSKFVAPLQYAGQNFQKLIQSKKLYLENQGEDYYAMVSATFYFIHVYHNLLLAGQSKDAKRTLDMIAYMCTNDEPRKSALSSFEVTK